MKDIIVEDVPAKMRLQNYELDPEGRPILETTQRVPRLSMEQSSEIPIMGLPLMTFSKSNVSVGAKEHSDKLWGLFSNMIMLSAHSENAGKSMLISKIIDKHDEVVDVEELIQKAMTYGVPIEKHGNSIAFKEKVDQYQTIINNYRKSPKRSLHDQ